MQTDVFGFPVFPFGIAKTKEEECMRVCTELHAMEVRDLKNMRNPASAKCADFTCLVLYYLRVLFMKSDTPLHITECYEW